MAEEAEEAVPHNDVDVNADLDVNVDVNVDLVKNSETEEDVAYILHHISNPYSNASHQSQGDWRMSGNRTLAAAGAGTANGT